MPQIVGKERKGIEKDKKDNNQELQLLKTTST